MRGAIGLAVGTKDIGDFGSSPGAGLGVGVATYGTLVLPAADEQIGRHRGVDSAHEGLLDSPNPCGPVQSQPRRHPLWTNKRSRARPEKQRVKRVGQQLPQQRLSPTASMWRSQLCG